MKNWLKFLKNSVVEGEIQGIALVDAKAGVRVGTISPDRVRFLQVDKDGNKEVLLSDPFDPSKPLRDLRNWVEDGFRKQLAYWIMGILWNMAYS